MIKQDIVREYANFIQHYGLDAEDAVLSAGGACVMHGVRANTSDLDISVSGEMFNLLEESGYVSKVIPSLNPLTPSVSVIKWNPHVDVHRALQYNAPRVVVEGVCCYTVEATLKQKLAMSRQKDQSDIVALKALLGAKVSKEIEDLMKRDLQAKLANHLDQIKDLAKQMDEGWDALSKDERRVRAGNLLAGYSKFFSRPPSPETTGLSVRELDCLLCVVQGMWFSV